MLLIVKQSTCQSTLWQHFCQSVIIPRFFLLSCWRFQQIHDASTFKNWRVETRISTCWVCAFNVLSLRFQRVPLIRRERQPFWGKYALCATPLVDKMQSGLRVQRFVRLPDSNPCIPDWFCRAWWERHWQKNNNRGLRIHTSWAVCQGVPSG